MLSKVFEKFRRQHPFRRMSTNEDTQGREIKKDLGAPFRGGEGGCR